MGYFGFINRWGRIEIILIIKKPGSRAGFALTCYVTLSNSITMCQFFYLNIEGTKLDHFPSSSKHSGVISAGKVVDDMGIKLHYTFFSVYM